ncbi:hypothetical protein RF55_3821 [Lasius niger]|uniref:Uncharacterized protein n=1 Tax=Lasius niger TaxID=67767 RepID=A0A0J7NU49_LASNI|nr:hypothetical protein RF55_3821 [Lasius niger]
MIVAVRIALANFPSDLCFCQITANKGEIHNRAKTTPTKREEAIHVDQDNIKQGVYLKQDLVPSIYSWVFPFNSPGVKIASNH